MRQQRAFLPSLGDQSEFLFLSRPVRHAASEGTTDGSEGSCPELAHVYPGPEGASGTLHSVG